MKRTPEEQRRHDLRKARKAARKAAKRARDAEGSDEQAGPSSKRHKASSKQDYTFEFDAADSCDDYGPRFEGCDPDYARMEEEDRFRDKMWGAYADDERLDSVEAAFNSYAHIPRRWRGGGMDRIDDEDHIDPSMMEDEDYAEWIRASMWRRKHAAEAAAYDRQKQEAAERKEREKKIREETRRMEKAEEERRRQRRREKENRKWEHARAYYEQTWKQILDGNVDRELRFEDVPWPVFFDKDVDVEAITTSAMATFLLPDCRPIGGAAVDEDALKRERRDKLRETMLRFHPDKFEGRFLRHVREADQQRVLEGVGLVARGLNTLLSQ